MRVLAIDDDADVLRLLRIKLSKEGHEVATAADGRSAVEALEQEPPDLVILELEVPGTPGLEIVRVAKGQSTAPLVIVLTHKRGDEDIAAGLAAGADDYLLKPFSPRVLSERIRVAAIRVAADRVD